MGRDLGRDGEDKEKNPDKLAMENTNIEWARHTFNPWEGCTKVSPGCLHCYAETRNRRWAGTEVAPNWGKGAPRRRTSAANWRKPLKWNREARSSDERPRVFCASLADVFDEEVPSEWRYDLFELIMDTPELDWLLLTKRPENIEDMIADIPWVECDSWILHGDFLENVWLGTTAEDQTRWDERIEILTNIPAAVHFVSAEPLLGPIQMGDVRPDWLIVGGESGPGARPMENEWAKSLRDQCDQRTAFHFKQWGGVNKKKRGRILDGRTWDQLPEPRTL